MQKLLLIVTLTASMHVHTTHGASLMSYIHRIIAAYSDRSFNGPAKRIKEIQKPACIQDIQQAFDSLSSKDTRFYTKI